MSLVNIKTYPVSHNKGNGGGGVTYINNSRKANIPDNLYVKSVNASLGYIDYLRSKSFSANDANITDLISERANITNLYGENISFNNGQIDTLNSNIINTKQLTAEDIAALRGIINDLKSDNITTETLTVTGQAHFFELIIDKIKAIGGQLLISAASCEIDYVRAFDANDNEIMPENFVSDYDQIEYFIVYWESKNSEGDEISNDWIANDQAICQSFNKAKTGISRDISNKYYWRLVNSVSNSPLYINYTTGQTTDNQTIASKNTYNISFLETQGIGTGSTTPLNNNISWHITPLDLVSGTWTGTDNVKEPSGVFDTTSAANGLVLTPIAMQQMPITDVLRLTVNHSSNKTIDNAYDVIVMFEDGTANVFADNSTSNSTITFNLQNVNTPITSITIMTKAPIDWHLCHYMRLSNVTATANKNTQFDSDGEIEAVIPEIGDNIVQLGYRGTDALNAYRQSAIIISAYKTPDTDITPPSYAQYIGINDFNLRTHRQSYFDAIGARFLGDITLASINGNSILNVLDNVISTAVSDSMEYTDEKGTQITENLESSIEQSAGMIRTEVKRSYGSSDTTLDDNNSNKYFADLTPATFNESKYYKVTITPNDATSYNDKHVFISQIERNLESDDTTWGKPSYGKQTSPFGFNLMLNMSFITGSTGLWTNGNLYVNEYYLQYSDAIVCGDTGIEQANRCFTIWLRGGSRYMIRTSSQSSIAVLTTEKSNVDEPVTYTPTMSSIEQTAERISLSVFEENGVTEEELNRTGIDIENGKIILDAQNTIFNGNVVMNNPDDGLIIQDEYGNAKINIQNNEIGTLDNFDFGINNVIRCTNNNTYGAVTSITETFDTVNLGSLKSGQKLFVTNMGLDAYINNVPDARVTAVSYSYTIKCGSTTIVTNSGNATYSSLYTLSWRVPDYINNNLSSTGSYTLVMTATFIISGRGQFVSHFGGNIYGQNTNIIRLAIDGGVLATSDTIYNWFGSDKTQLRNGAQAIRLLNGKIQRNSYNTGTPSTFMNNWSDISSTIPYRIINTTNYTATVDDGLIYFATDLSQPTMRTLTLPAASTCPGKIFFVKNGTSGNVFRIVSQQTTGDFMWHSDNTIQNQIDDAGRESYFFISCRLFWISFNCD